MKISDLKWGDVIHCPTFEEAQQITRLLHESGRYWADGNSYADDINWSKYGTDTCYNPTKGKIASIHFYRGAGNNIYEAKEFLTQQKTVSTAPLEPKTIKDMKVVKTKNVSIQGQARALTIAVLVVKGYVRAGYSIKMPADKEVEGLSEKIAEGRALTDRTNLLDMTMGIGMDKKYILHAIADNLIQEIEEGKIVIKGVKAPKTKQRGITITKSTEPVADETVVYRAGSVEEIVRTILVDKLGVETNEVLPDSNLAQDLGADDLDRVEIVMKLEREFDITIPDDAVEPDDELTFAKLVGIVNERRH